MLLGVQDIVGEVSWRGGYGGGVRKKVGKVEREEKL